MYLRTQSDWELKSPLYKIFDSPKNPSKAWRAVEFTLSVNYYHVHFCADENDQCRMFSTVVVGDFHDALTMLNHYKDSKLDLQVPRWKNRGRPGLYPVKVIYKSSECKKDIYVAECTGNRRFYLGLNDELDMQESANINLEVFWKAPKR